MRTTLDLPDPLLRQLKARAALEGTTLKELMRTLVERGLRSPPEAAEAASPPSTELPTIKLGRPLNLPRPSNAALFELLDD
jgi:hypothetical protein